MDGWYKWLLIHNLHEFSARNNSRSPDNFRSITPGVWSYLNLSGNTVLSKFGLRLVICTSLNSLGDQLHCVLRPYSHLGMPSLCPNELVPPVFPGKTKFLDRKGHAMLRCKQKLKPALMLCLKFAKESTILKL